jgi:16S rRNA (adenine1518-N6/adenine1519-N6)-dimethyltransferase
MDISTTKALLRKHDFRPKKRLGQHFLVDSRAAEKIAAAAQIGPDETVLEVGPGLGALTGPLLDQARRVIAVEVDERLCTILEAELGGHPGLEVVNGDFLKVNIPELASESDAGGLKVVGNLPYHITGPALRMILDQLHLLRLAVLTVQREVAARILADPGGKAFGVLSVVAQYRAQTELVFRLPQEAFYPQPQVASSVVMLSPRPQPPINLADEDHFFTMVKTLFSHRRKTAQNALRLQPGLRLSAKEMNDLSRSAQIDLRRRAETMSLQELGGLSNVLWEMQHAEGQN